MFDKLPEVVDLERVSRNGADFKGEFALSKMTRLQEACQEADGNAEIDLALEFKNSRKLLTGEVRAVVKLECQRCLVAIETNLVADVDLEIVKVMADEHRHHDVFELDEEGNLALLELVEDELLLQVPVVPKHLDAADCNQDMLNRGTEYVPEEAEVEKNNPFAVLQKLKK